ncbi:MAG: hypothetical protein IJQ01_05880 [Selenomonadaceae bacterium]|nr:hypothetical protein [Selenomonadaceae bacterium]
MDEFGYALYDLCDKVESFRWASRDIIVPERKRRERLKEIAEELRKATEDFLEAVDNGRTDKDTGGRTA